MSYYSYMFSCKETVDKNNNIFKKLNYQETILPVLSILLFPIGITKSFDKTSSETGNAWPYKISFSRKTTGSGSLMAAFNNPLQSSDE